MDDDIAQYSVINLSTWVQKGCGCLLNEVCTDFCGCSDTCKNTDTNNFFCRNQQK